MAEQNLPPPFFERGDTIGRILVIEFNDQDSSVFDEVMAVLKHHSAFEQLRFNEEDVLSLPGLEIYPDRRKIYRNRREINLTAKEYDLLCLLVANKGRVLTYEQIYQRIWGEEHSLKVTLPELTIGSHSSYWHSSVAKWWSKDTD